MLRPALSCPKTSQRVKMKHSLPIMVLTVATLSALSASTFAISSHPHGKGHAGKSGTSITVHYERPWIEASIQNARLLDVFRTLAEKAPLRYSFAQREIAEYPISAVVRTTKLVEGVRQILSGFSYAIDVRRSHIQVLVLSAVTSAPTIDAETEAAYVPYRQVHAVSEPSLLEAPNDLESEVIFAAAEREEHEVHLQRVLTDLHSLDVNQRTDAINELLSIDDPSAVQALIGVTNAHDKHEDVPLRLAAVDALAQYALDNNFSDRSVVEALEQLAGDTEESVAGAAQMALQHRE